MTSRLTAAERETRDEIRNAAKKADAREALADQAAAQAAFSDNSERLAREVELRRK
jgi:hypothetical protein